MRELFTALFNENITFDEFYHVGYVRVFTKLMNFIIIDVWIGVLVIFSAAKFPIHIVENLFPEIPLELRSL